MQCPRCAEPVEPRRGEVILFTLDLKDVGPDEVVPVPIIVATVYECFACGWSVAGDGEGDTFEARASYLPMSFVLSETLKYNDERKQQGLG